MNIKQAKQEITNTLKAYLAKDQLGNYLIPTVRQRPVLLMGPPGVGKTQIMEQIAAETGVGLVAYTITHHTRQSAIGLPFIEKRTYGGEEVSVTEYTMSEILSSVYRLMERTGLQEGILFLDEINCVSETLAPMMLQFLQCKTFGNQALPEGWLIVAAGNPPEYNKSVRDFDVVTLDRVKRIDVEEDYGVWKEYARRKNLHGAIRSYLDIKKDNFYRIENTADGLQFATARGWEDLSELLYAYETLGIRADREVVGQYIQMPRIAKDFANYLEMFYKYQKTYHVEGILSGTWENITVLELREAPFDEKLSVMGLVLSRLSEEARNTRCQDALTDALHTSLTEFREKIADAPPLTVLDQLLWKRRTAMKQAKEAGQLDKESRDLKQREINALEDYRQRLDREAVAPEGAMDAETLGIRADREVVGQYIQMPRIAKDFANYLEMFYKYQKTYHVEGILSGTWENITVLELREAPFDEKLSVMGLVLSRLSEEARNTRCQDALTDALHTSLTEFREKIADAPPLTVLDQLLWKRRTAMKQAKEAGQLDKESRDLKQREINALEDYRQRLDREAVAPEGAMDAVRGWFGEEVERRKAVAMETKDMFDNAFRFLETTFGDSQELVIFVTEITAGYDTSWFVEQFGCDAYFRHNRELLFDSTRHRIREEIAAAKAAEQEENT